MTYTIETERLGLREYTPDDFDALYEIMSDPETMQHYPAPFTEERTRRWITWNLENYKTYGFGLWAVVLKETGEFIGDCGVTIQNIDGEMYYFDKDGVCATGWKTIDGKKYYFAAGCQMYLRWKRIDGEKYYFDPLSGYMHTGWEWVPEKDAWYYLDPDTGATVTGTRTIDGKTYTFGSDGAMQ